MTGLRVTRAGERLRGVGVLVTSRADEPLRGLQVRVHGPAVARGHVELTAVRARPWSARLAPWEASGWEHSLARQRDDVWGCTLRAVTVRPDATNPGEGVRRAMLRAVWVEIDARGVTPGEGVLTLAVAPEGRSEWVQTAVTVRVDAPVHDVLSLYLGWQGPMALVAPRVRRVVSGIARWLGRLPSGPRAMAAEGTVRERLYARDGCVVLGRTGLAGDPRWEQMLTEMEAPGWEGLALRLPGGTARADETLELTVVDASRFAPAPVELVWSVGRAWLGRKSTVPDWVRWLRRGDPVHGFVAWHPWVPSLLACTPWERARAEGPSRTVRDLSVRGRIDTCDAVAVHPLPAASLPGRND